MKADEYFDEEFYLRNYPDVTREVNAGRQKSALAHYIAHGKAEGRLPFAFDEDWYIQTNPDVQAALENGAINSARSHYVTHGRFESRSPLPPDLPAACRTFAFGAYGTNNVGDEAIFEGLRSLYPEAIQIFHHTASCQNSIKIDYAFAYKKLFQLDSRLIVGGGGLLYSQSAIDDMIRLAESARSAGARVDILGIGCEGAQQAYHDDIRNLVSMAETVSCRTTMSVEILTSITGRQIELQRDFAFNLAPEFVPLFHRPISDRPLIGLVTGGDLRVNLSRLESILSKHLVGVNGVKARFVHIPHSQAFDDRYNNDVVVGNLIWSDLSTNKLRAQDGFTVAPFTADPRKVLSLYSQLDGVMSERFHGLVFGRMLGIPTLALSPHTSKNQSFIRDYVHAELFTPTSIDDLENTCDEFLEYVLDIKMRKPGK